MKKKINLLICLLSIVITVVAIAPAQQILAESTLINASKTKSNPTITNIDSLITSLQVHNSTIYTGDFWKPINNFDNAITKDGVSLSFNSFIAMGETVNSGNLNSNIPGVYTVTYSINDITSSAKVTVLKNELNIKGDSLVRYVGDDIPADFEFNTVGTDYNGTKVPVYIDKSRIDMNKAGNYTVFFDHHIA